MDNMWYVIIRKDGRELNVPPPHPTKELALEAALEQRQYPHSADEVWIIGAGGRIADAQLKKIAEERAAKSNQGRVPE